MEGREKERETQIDTHTNTHTHTHTHTPRTNIPHTLCLSLNLAVQSEGGRETQVSLELHVITQVVLP